MTARRTRPLRRSLLAALSSLTIAGAGLPYAQGAHAQGACAPTLARPGAWPAPLDRPVSLTARDIALRDALARLSAAAGIRLSYSADLLPLDQRVCVSSEVARTGDLLVALLRAARVQAVVAAPDHVVLAPLPAMAAVEADSFTRRPAAVLERVVITGSAAGAPQRSLTIAVNLVDGGEMEESGTGTVARALRSVPGVWAWSPSPASLLTRYGSVRGASSFGLSYPKVYIDGIEVANPLLVSRFTPEALERIEVIRGPQGAALYGTDAISGVVNIVTRHESADSGAPRFRFRSGVGVSRSDFSPNATVAQEHALSFRTGSTARSLGADLSVGTAGEYIPDAFSRQVGASANMRVVGSRSITSVIARFETETAGVPVSPVLSGIERPVPGFPADSGEHQSVHQYTLGVSSTLSPSDRWTHSLTVGVDGDRLSGLPDDRLPIPFAGEQDDGVANGGADRGSVRLSTVARLGDLATSTTSLTLAAEHSVLRQAEEWWSAATADQPRTFSSAVDWRSNSGLVAQASTGVRDLLYLTGGLRLERMEGLEGAQQIATLPMFGSAIVFGDESFTFKLRSAYGKGIRPSRTPARQTGWAGYRAQLQTGSLDPEEQSGIETGFDLIFGDALTLQLTRFDQTASGLIQRVAVARTPAPTASYPAPKHRMSYALQNVGQITNRGWEVQATSELGRLALTGALSLVGSTVDRVAAGYTGELRPGDRMLEVPARTLALHATWNGRSWYATGTLQRAADWVNYDRLALAQAIADGTDPAQLVGTRLRDYWREYDGITHLDVTASRNITETLLLVLTGENLLDVQRGEPDDLTVLPGRTLTFGVRAAF